QPAPGTSYYRLKQTDFNGTATYSWVVPVHCAGNADLLLFPNPASDRFHCRLPASPEAQVLQVHDALGRTVWSREFPASATVRTVEVDLGRGAHGVYSVTC